MIIILTEDDYPRNAPYRPGRGNMARLSDFRLDGRMGHEADRIIFVGRNPIEDVVLKCRHGDRTVHDHEIEAARTNQRPRGRPSSWRGFPEDRDRDTFWDRSLGPSEIRENLMGPTIEQAMAATNDASVGIDPIYRWYDTEPDGAPPRRNPKKSKMKPSEPKEPETPAPRRIIRP
jgi:hypothetical protein